MLSYIPILDMRKRQRRESGSDIEGEKGCDDYYQHTFHYFLKGYSGVGTICNKTAGSYSRLSVLVPASVLRHCCWDHP